MLMFCTNCGNKLSDTAKFCTACGQKVDNAGQVPAPVDTQPEMPVQSPIVQNSMDPIVPPVEQGTMIQNSLDPIAPPESQGPVVQNSMDPVVPPVEPDATLIYADADPDLAEQKKPRKKKNKGLIIGIIAGVVAIVAVAVTLSAITLNKKSNLYRQARELMAQKNYAEAVAIFEELGGYKESEVILDELKEKQEAYEEALELLNERKFDEAMEAFQDLKDYADSADQVSFNVNYQKARYLMESAGTGDMEALSLLIPEGSAVAMDSAPIMLYEAAGEIFLSLGEYNDAHQLAMQCYYGAGQVHLEQGNWENALVYMDMMDESNAEAFYQEYLSYCADGSAMEDLKHVLVSLESIEDPAVGNELERDTLEPYIDAHFADEGVKEQIMKYLDGVYLQKSVLNYLDTIDGWLEYTRGAAMCAEAIDALYADYGFLADDEELVAKNVGLTEITWAYYHVYGMLHDCLNGQEAFHAEGMYFVQMENNTEYDGTLVYSITCRKNDKVVYKSEEMRVDFTAGDSPVIPMGFMVGEVDFDAWNITYYGLENVKLNGELLPQQN